jgi:hypothetical protein
MKKFYTAFLFLLISIGAYSQCTPDNTHTLPGYLPNVLDTAFVGENYEMVVHIRIPADTTVTFFGQTIVADIDSIRLVNVVGMPNSFSYQCNVASCTFTPTQTYCAKITGMATNSDVGTHPLRFAVVAYASADVFGTRTSLPAQADTLDQFDMIVDRRGGTSSIKELIQDKAFHIYPNPTQKQFNILLNGVIGETISYEVVDVTGKVFAQESITLKSANDVVSASSENWAAGFYFVRIQNAKGIFTQRLVVENY